MMPPKVVLQVVAGLVILTLAGLTAVRGAPDTPAEWMAPIAPAVGVAWTGLWVFNRWAWRWRGIRGLTGRPLLDGTWHGELVPQALAGGAAAAVDGDIFMVVRQCFWSISVRLFTRESTSSSCGASLNRHDDGVYELVYVYINTPQHQVRERSGIHYGGAVLSAPKSADHGVHGQYFTDRKSRGDLSFHTRYATHIESYVAGPRLVAAA